MYDDGYRRRSYTYEDVGRAARGFAAKLRAAGLRKGDKVVFWGENRPEWLACYWGCLISGIIVVPIDYRSSAEFVGQSAGPRPRPGRPHRGRRASHSPRSRDFGGAAQWRFADFDWQSDGPMPGVEVSRDDIMQIIFTSGATAEPKGVVIRHRNVLANIVPVEREVLKYRRYAPAVSPPALPQPPAAEPHVRPVDGHQHSADGARHGDLHAQLQPARPPPPDSRAACVGAGVRAEDPGRPARPRRARLPGVDRGAAAPGTSIPGRWWRYRRVHSAFGLKFWAFVVGAAPLPPELEEFWRRMGFVVIQGYGLTETAPIVTLNHPFKTSQGRLGRQPIAGVEMRIADDGEILVRGENVTSGYYVDGPRARDRGCRHRLRRLAAHRRHRRARRAGAAVHQGPEEGDDRHAGRAQRLSGGRRAHC